MKKTVCIFLLVLLSVISLSAVDSFAKWTKTELIFDNGIVQRTIRLPSAGGNYMTVSYKPVSGNFNYFQSNLTDFQFEVNDIVYSGNGNWSLSDITNISDSKEGNGAGVTLISQDEKVKLTIKYLLYPNSPAIRKSLIVNNLTDKPVRLESVDVEKLEVPPYNPVTFSWIYHDYGRRRFIGPYEGGKQDALIIVHNMNLEQGIVIGNEATGVMKHTSVFWETQDICVGLTHRNALFPFRKWIEKGESFETPQVFTMVYNNQKTPDEMLNIAVPDFVRKYMGIRLSELKEKPTFVYNTWEPFLKNINEKLVMELAKAAADAGMKEFIIDDGWQNSYGDWGIDMKKFPNGLKPVFDYIKSLGMKPGLWVSIGSASPSSKVYKAHPEWFVLDRHGDHTSLHAPNDKEKFTACFGTGWYDYIKEILLKLAVDYGLEYFKLDFAVVTSAYTYDHTQSGCYSTTHPGHKDHNESLFTNYERLWQLFDELHAAKQNLFIDCTFETLGGTQLIDYALLKHAEGDWLSNFEGTVGEKTDIRIRNMAWWRSPAIPATALVIGNPQMQDKEWEMHIKSIAGVLPIMLGDPRKLSENDQKKYRVYADWLELMESKYGIMSFRQDLPGFGEPMEGMWDGFQRINTDTKNGGIIGVFRHGSVETNRIITLKWLDPVKTYDVRSMNGNVVATLIGSDLQSKGFSLNLEDHYSGDLFEISVSGNNSINVQALTNQPLRVLADKAGLLIGVRAFLKDEAQKKIVVREFNTSTRTCYPNSIDRSPGQHDLESFNTGVNWLYERGMKPMHHMLFGPSQYEAPWVREITSVSRLDSLMKERIRSIMESNDNGSKVNVWNVVNEALSWNKEETGNYFAEDKVVWVRMGYEDDKSGLTGDDRINARHPVFIRKAFEYAGKYARGKLELRETGCETPGRKSQTLYQLVRHLQNSGVKIDGVGLQCHYNLEGEGVIDPGGLAAVIRKFRSTGVEVYLTEVDFGRKKVPWTPELAEKQKQEYKKLISVALEEGVSQVHLWGLRDADENWRGDENPLLFDENLNPKPAYYGVKEALMEFLEKGTGKKPEKDIVQPGEFIVEPPTLTNLGFEWYISGDDDRNATVSVEYRISGTQEWKEALPLLRLGDEHAGREKEKLDYTVPHMFAGSILDVAPDTEYECRFTMKDSDNAVREMKTTKVRTRAEPQAFQGGRILHVYPAKWVGDKKEPSFTTLQGAYYGSGTGDWSVVRERTVQPGDIIEVHAGLYEADRSDYVNPEGIPFDGTYYLTVKATRDRPVVIRSAGDGEVIFDGAGAHILFDVSASENHIFEGLTIRNADIAFYAGNKHIIGAKDLTIRKCRMENVGEGIITEYAGSTNFYIADNVLIGRDDRYRLLGWANAGNINGVNKMYSYIGIKVYGSGHVICNNAIAYFHDAIDVSTYGTPESQQELKAVSIDIYNNDIHLMADDFIEADGGVHNIRVMRNRCVNAAQCGLSAQPVFGGPAYFLRNVIYHVPTGIVLKFMARPAGLYVLHNTFIAENSNSQTFSNAHFRNNLFLGTDAPGRPVAVFPNATSYSTSDYNGYRPNTNDKNYRWVSPAAGELQNYSISVSRDGKVFNSLKELAVASGLEKHGIEIDYDVFENLRPPDSKKPGFVYHATDLNFILKAKGKAVDVGEKLPNINDNFTGKAPDLGALEVGTPEPVYGPRGEVFNRPFYR